MSAQHAAQSFTAPLIGEACCPAAPHIRNQVVEDAAASLSLHALAHRAVRRASTLACASGRKDNPATIKILREIAALQSILGDRYGERLTREGIQILWPTPQERFAKACSDKTADRSHALLSAAQAIVAEDRATANAALALALAAALSPTRRNHEQVREVLSAARRTTSFAEISQAMPEVLTLEERAAIWRYLSVTHDDEFNAFSGTFRAVHVLKDDQAFVCGAETVAALLYGRNWTPQQYEQLIERLPNNLAKVWAFIEASHHLRDNESAITLLRQAEKVLSSSQGDDGYSLSLALAVEYHKRGDQESAFREAQRAVSHLRKTDRLTDFNGHLAALGSIFSDAGDYATVEKLARRADRSDDRAMLLLQAARAAPAHKRERLCEASERELWAITYDVSFTSCAKALLKFYEQHNQKTSVERLLRELKTFSETPWQEVAKPFPHFLIAHAEILLELKRPQSAAAVLRRLARRVIREEGKAKYGWFQKIHEVAVAGSLEDVQRDITDSMTKLASHESPPEDCGVIRRVMEALVARKDFDRLERLVRSLPYNFDDSTMRWTVIPTLLEAQENECLIRIAPKLAAWLAVPALGGAAVRSAENGDTHTARGLLRAGYAAAETVEADWTRGGYLVEVAMHALQAGQSRFAQRVIDRSFTLAARLQGDERKEILSELLQLHRDQTVDGVEKTISLHDDLSDQIQLQIEFAPLLAKAGRSAGGKAMLREAATRVLSLPKDEQQPFYEGVTRAAAALGLQSTARRFIRSARAAANRPDNENRLSALLRAALLARACGERSLFEQTARNALRAPGVISAWNDKTLWREFIEASLADGAYRLLELAIERLERQGSQDILLETGTAFAAAKRLETPALPFSSAIIQQLPSEERRHVYAAAGTMLPAEATRGFAQTLPEAERAHAETIIRRSAVVSSGPLAENGAGPLIEEVRRDLLAWVTTNDSKVGPLIRTSVETLVELKSSVANQALIEATRAASQGASRNVHLPYLLEALDRVATHRANDMILEAITTDKVDWRVSRFLIRRLARREFLDASLHQWMSRAARQRKGLPGTGKRVLEQQETAMLVSLLQRGLNPSREVLVHLHDGEWRAKDGKFLTSVSDRILSLTPYESQFAGAASADQLIGVLSTDKSAALAFYILRAGASRFALINNYSFRKFREIIGDAAEIRPHTDPLDEFFQALRASGMDSATAATIRQRLLAGAPPIDGSMSRLLRLDVSNNGRLEAANQEAGAVMGSRQLGVCLKSPLYRSYLSEESGDHPLLAKLEAATTLASRGEALKEIEHTFPQFAKRVLRDLEARWSRVNGTLALGTTLQNILLRETNVIECTALLTHVEAHRQSLRNTSSALLAALRGEHPQLRAISAEIHRKTRALENLQSGLAINPSLNRHITAIRDELSALESKCAEITGQVISRRYAGLTPQDRTRRIEEETRKLQVIAEKDPSAILMHLLMSLVDETLLTEGDVQLVRELASHLASPLHVAKEVADKLSDESAVRVSKVVRLRYLDKRSDLMTLLRFADSKICCFSSCNYQMHVAHQKPNRHWVASFARDPLSFIFAIEDVMTETEVASRARRNIGFVCGSFAIRNGVPGLLLNGVYLADGTDATAAASILNAIEEVMSAPLGLRWQLVASVLGGKIRDPVTGYEMKTIEAKRLRALADCYGKPITTIYDDLGDAVNVETSFSGFFREFVPAAGEAALSA